MAAFDGPTYSPTCGYGTTSAFVVVTSTRGVSDGSTAGGIYHLPVSRRLAVNQTSGTVEVPLDMLPCELTVEYRYGDDTRPDADVIRLPLPERVVPRAPRTRVQAPTLALLPPKQAARRTAVPWTRGRAPRGWNFRVLRAIADLRR